MTAPLATEPPAIQPHSAGEDVYAILMGVSFLVVGLVCLGQAGLVTGGTAGLALLLSYILPIPMAATFMALNLPFLWLAWRTLGTAFAVRTALVSAGVSGGAIAAPHLFHLAWIDPLFAAVFGGTLIGMGVLALARHGAGVGGLGVLALVLARSRGWNAGRTTLIGDCLILGAALPVLPFVPFLLSLVSAAAISAMLIAWHKPGRYTGF